jgi:hypothetical protein
MIALSAIVPHISIVQASNRDDQSMTAYLISLALVLLVAIALWDGGV